MLEATINRKRFKTVISAIFIIASFLIAEVCKYLCVDNPSVSRVCQVCEDASFDHIKIEGSRLMASLVKNSSDLGINNCMIDSCGIHY